MKIFLGADHGGFQLKKEIFAFLKTEFPDAEIVDLGTDDEKSVDYPAFGAAVATKVVENPKSLGVIFCGTGIGISIAANKIAGARAALCENSTAARLARQHNDANILALGGRMIGGELARDIVKTFFKNKFEGGRHARRVGQISDLEK